jgi:hypothetical protein
MRDEQAKSQKSQAKEGLFVAAGLETGNYGGGSWY